MGPDDWVNHAQKPVLVWFLRLSEVITESTVRLVQEKMKEENLLKAIVFSSSFFSPGATQFVSNRMIDLITPPQIQKMLVE